MHGYALHDKHRSPTNIRHMTQQELQTFREIKKRAGSMLTQSNHLVIYYLICWVIACFCIFGLSDNGMQPGWIYIGIGIAVSPGLHLAFLAVKLLANLLAIKVLAFQVSNGIKEEEKPKKAAEEKPSQPEGTYIGGIKLEDY